jgi:hypothetical protein
MAIKQISKFQTSDGQEFFDRDVAKEHQLRLDILVKLTDAFGPTIRTGRPDALLDLLVNDLDSAMTVRDIINELIRKSPRKNAVEVEA